MHLVLSCSLQLFFLEERRRQCLQDLATLIQKIYRGWKGRTHFLLLKKSQIVVAAWYRRYAVRPFEEMHSNLHIQQNKPIGSIEFSVVNLLSLPFPSHSNKRNTTRSRAPPLWCSPTPEDGRCAPSCEFTPFRIKCIGKSCGDHYRKQAFKLSACYMSTRPANS